MIDAMRKWRNVRSLSQKHRERLLQILLFGTIIFNFLLIFRVAGRDAGAFLIIASGVNQGQIPYVDYIDHKPPGIYYFLAGVLSLNNSLLFAKLSILFTNLLTATLIVFISKRYYSYSTGIASAAVYLASIPIYQGTRILTEQFVALFGVIMIGLLLLSEEDLTLSQSLILRFLAGVSIGFAFLFKQTGVLFTLGLAGYYIIEAPRRFVRGVLPAAIGSLLPVIGAAAYFYHLDALSEAIHWVVQIHLPGGSYGSQGTLSVLLSQSSNLLSAGPLWILVVSSLIGLKTLRSKYDHHYTAWVLPVIVTSPILLFRSYPHYWIQILPFAVVLGTLSVKQFGPPIMTVMRQQKTAPIILAAVLVLSVPVGAGVGTVTYATATNPIQDDYNVAQHIQNQSAPGDQILVLTAQPKYYYLSERSPPTNNIYYLGANRQQYSSEQLRQEIDSDPPPVVVIADCRLYISSVCDLVRERYDQNRSVSGVKVYSNPH